MRASLCTFLRTHVGMGQRGSMVRSWTPNPPIHIWPLWQIRNFHPSAHYKLEVLSPGSRGTLAPPTTWGVPSTVPRPGKSLGSALCYHHPD